MRTRHDRLASATRDSTPSVADLMWEGDAMELDLGKWLAKRGRKVAAAQRVNRIGVDCLHGLHASGWRALILIWSTSPEVRGRYSAESRGGLFTAAEAMDDATLLSLVRGMIDGGDGRPRRMVAA